MSKIPRAILQRIPENEVRRISLRFACRFAYRKASGVLRKGCFAQLNMFIGLYFKISSTFFVVGNSRSP